MSQESTWKPRDPVDRLQALRNWLGDELQEGTFKETVPVMDTIRQIDDAIAKEKLGARGMLPSELEDGE